jgi:hypothetical protein|tara:strand:- start:1012 stop:1206 length:195 start_codon:yes stop_codon:yes gene_type:complete
MQQLTERQVPVLLRLQSLLDEMQAVSNAVLDNTFEDVEPLPQDNYVLVREQLEQISHTLFIATK